MIPKRWHFKNGAAPAKPCFSERYGHCITGDPEHISPHLEQCDCTNWQSLSAAPAKPADSQGAETAEQFAQQMVDCINNLPRPMDDEWFANFFKERLEAYAAERVASAEKQRNDYLTDAINETSKRLDLEKQVEELKMALRLCLGFYDNVGELILWTKV